MQNSRSALRYWPLTEEAFLARGHSHFCCELVIVQFMSFQFEWLLWAGQYSKLCLIRMIYVVTESHTCEPGHSESAHTFLHSV